MWPPEALEFLRELEDNNDRDWFRANRARYDEHLVAPARELTPAQREAREAYSGLTPEQRKARKRQAQSKRRKAGGNGHAGGDATSAARNGRN